MTQYTEAQRNLMVASFELGQAQRELDDAQEKFRQALAKVESLEGLSFTNGERK